MSTNINNEDILIELSKGDLEEMLLILKDSMPTNIRIYNYIRSYLVHFNVDKEKLESGRWNFKFYGPRIRNPRYCTLVAITDVKDYFVSVFTLEEDASELKTTLENTKIIQWKREALEFFTEEHIFKLIENIVKTKRPLEDWEPLVTEYIMYMPKELIKRFPKLSIPEDFELIPLRTEHADKINNYWQYKRENSYFLIRESIELNGGSGMIRKADENLLAWITMNDFFALGFLYVMESERGKGLGTLIFQEEMKRVVEKFNIDIVTCVVCENQTSFELHKKLGFEVVNKIVFLTKSE